MEGMQAEEGATGMSGRGRIGQGGWHDGEGAIIREVQWWCCRLDNINDSLTRVFYYHKYLNTPTTIMIFIKCLQICFHYYK